MPLSVHTYIGLIMLLGLVTKNGILLVDFTNVLIKGGYELVEGAREAARSRFRPVLMTAFSTILGMMPVALVYGAGGEVRSPLGFAVAAGLFTSTFLTLIVVPVFYTIINQVQQRILRMAGRGEKKEGPMRQDR